MRKGPVETANTDRQTSKAGVFITACRNRSLLLIEIAWLAFNGAEWGIWLTLSVWAYTHGGAAAVSLIIIVQLVPCILLAPYLGAITDRARAGRVLFFGLLITGLAMGGLAAAMALEWAGGEVRPSLRTIRIDHGATRDEPDHDVPSMAGCLDCGTERG